LIREFAQVQALNRFFAIFVLQGVLTVCVTISENLRARQRVVVGRGAVMGAAAG